MFYLIIDGQIADQSKDFDSLVEKADAEMTGTVVSKEDWEASQ